MSDTINPTSGGDESRPAGRTLTGSTGAGTAPESRGRTTIADSVVEKIAGMATREVPGIHSLGSGMARTLGAVTDKVPGGRPSVSRGVKVEVGERQAAVDLDVVVEYGVAIVDIAADVRTCVITAVERMTGLEVVEVNIAVDDVHLPDEEDDQEGEGRVQ
ncbi:Asp23/Gls24 family envelope stress response protein [Streptomyces lavendulae]|uniref:Asp23/Gls24 family envelope stress response protein n=1 Tax=Streptomyces lavendulae TaxID=1914 RepID=UPI0024A232FF|nr:Asp23/Gls24 family envelope stress response protein [Streptomyces lavendulae]GLW04347.1 stress protein [Streptomyces lavendulae subsp. lavendulae]